MLDKFEQIARKNISFHIMESRSLRNHCELKTVRSSYRIRSSCSYRSQSLRFSLTFSSNIFSCQPWWDTLGYQNMSRIRYVKDDVDKRKERFPLRSHSFDGSSRTRESFFPSLFKIITKTKKRRNFSGSVNVLLLVIKLLYIYINTRIT